MDKTLLMSAVVGVGVDGSSSGLNTTPFSKLKNSNSNSNCHRLYRVLHSCEATLMILARPPCLTIVLTPARLRHHKQGRWIALLVQQMRTCVGQESSPKLLGH